MNENYPHIKFEINRTGDRPTSFLEIDGQRIRFLNLEIKTCPGIMPLVTIQVYARMLEGDIQEATGELQIIHIDEGTKKDGWIGPGGRPDGCPAL